MSDLYSDLASGETCGAASEEAVNKVVKIITQVMYPTVKVKVGGDIN